MKDSSKSSGLGILLKSKNRMDSVLYIRKEGNHKRKKNQSSSLFYHLGKNTKNKGNKERSNQISGQNLCYAEST
jgi:hypothetical protein